MPALAANFAAGYLGTRVPPERLLAVSLFILAGGLAALPHLTSLPQVMMWATAMGMGGGIVTVLFFSVWPLAFGRRHLGRIQGSAQALTVLASALGPLMLAWCVESTGSYAAMFRILSGIIGALGAGALMVSVPRGRFRERAGGAGELINGVVRGALSALLVCFAGPHPRETAWGPTPTPSQRLAALGAGD